MTQPHPSPLVEKAYLELRTACGADREYRGYSVTDRDLRRAALAAVRVVVEAAAEVAKRIAKDYDADFESSCCNDTANLVADEIECLLPSEPEA